MSFADDVSAALAAAAAPAAPPPSAGASPRRFAVLGCYCAACFLCAGAWNTLAPIYAIAQERFAVSSGAVTLVALTLFLMYVPGSLLALYVTARHGLRANLLLGAALQTAMSALKWAGVELCADPHGAYALLLAGQVLGGLGQPLILNVVARLTMDWCARAGGAHAARGGAAHARGARRGEGAHAARGKLASCGRVAPGTAPGRAAAQQPAAHVQPRVGTTPPHRRRPRAAHARRPRVAAPMLPLTAPGRARAGSRPRSATWPPWWAISPPTRAPWCSTRCRRG
jgi:hypothetical protein